MKMEETVTRHSKETTSTSTTATTTMSMAGKAHQVEAAKKTEATQLPLYIDFEPFWTWQREEDKATLVGKLPEFKAEELKIRINNSGTLTISGERSIINGKGRVRFTKEVQTISKNYDASKITAKFTKDGFLHVTLPLQPEGGGESGRLNVAVAAAAFAALAMSIYATLNCSTSSSRGG